MIEVEVIDSTYIVRQFDTPQICLAFVSTAIASEVILLGQAKTKFAEAIAGYRTDEEGYKRTFNLIESFQAVRGKFNLSVDEYDPYYLGLLANRVWMGVKL